MMDPDGIQCMRGVIKSKWCKRQYEKQETHIRERVVHSEELVNVRKKHQT